MKILVLGTGVFGTLAATELRQRGHAVKTASRRTGVNAREEGSVAAALVGHDAILHAAGPFAHTEPGAARAAAKQGVPYVDLSDDREFSARVRGLDATAPLLTGMSTTPAVADALVALARARTDASKEKGTCAMYVGGANHQGPATMEFAARSRGHGPSMWVDFPGIGRRRAFPARAFADAEFYVAVGGVSGLGWRFRALTRLLAPYAHRLPRFGSDTAGALVAFVEGRSEALHALEQGQRLAVLPAVYALEEALAGRAPRRAALPHEWVDPVRLVAFLEQNGFTRTSA